MNDNLGAEVVSAVRRSLGLAPDEPLSSAELLRVLRRDKFPLLWLAPDAASEGSGKDAGAEPVTRRSNNSTRYDCSLLRSKEFRDALEEDRRGYTQLHAEHLRLVEKWDSAGVRSICFKSAGIAPSFPYAGDDVDILVPASEVEKARQILDELGYIEMANADEELSWQYRRFAAGRADSASIHLHARVGGEEGFVIEDELWARVRQSPDDPCVWIPGREDLALIILAHALMDKQTISLRSLVRLRHVLADGNIDWGYLDHVASERGWHSWLHLGLALLALLEEQLFGSSTVPPCERDRHERTLGSSLTLRRYWDTLQRRPPVLPFQLASAESKILLLERLWQDHQVPSARKAAGITRAVFQRIRQKAGLLRQRSMLISLSGLDGCGKSSQARLLRDAFESSGVRSQIVWMRLGETQFLSNLDSKLARLRRESLEGGESGHNTVETPVSKPEARSWVRRVLGYIPGRWRRILWMIGASLDYAAWLQRVRWRLWRGDVVIADRYLYDFEAELSVLLRDQPGLVTVLLDGMHRIAPGPKRAYLLRVAPEIALRRKPEDTFRGADPAEWHVLYDRLAARYGLRVFDSSQPVDDLADEIVRDAVSAYRADERLHWWNRNR